MKQTSRFKKLGSIETLLSTLGAIASNRTYGGRLLLIRDYLRAGIVYGRAGWNPTKRQRFRCGGFRLMSCHPRSFYTTFKEVFIEECYYFENLPDHPMIVDCGANIGMATCFFKRLRPNAYVWAIEPSPGSLELLKENLRSNDIEGVRVIAAALSDREGQALLLEEYPSGVSNRLSGEGKVSVQTLRLSKLIDRPVDLLKIDTEGMETVILEDVERSGKLGLVARLAIEFGLNESEESIRLSPLLTILERNGFRYVIDARASRQPGLFQSVTVRARRRMLHNSTLPERERDVNAV
jgi:FkbM family methyltransferase